MFRVGAGVWFVLMLAGFIAALALIDAPPAVAYQHYRFAASVGDVLAVGVLLVNAGLLLTLGRAHLHAVWRWLRNTGSGIALSMALAAIVVTSAAPSRDPGQYLLELLFATAVELILALMVLAMLRSLPASRPQVRASLDRMSAWVLGPPDAPGPRRLDRWSLLVALAVTLTAALLAVVVYDRHPHVPDEVVYLLQARYLADGLLTMPATPVPAAFNLDLMHYEATRWYSPVPPGWPFMLAVGAWLGVPWLVNPILAGVAIVLTYLWLGSIYDGRTTRLATLLLATSPWFLYMAMNFMTHTFTLVCGLGAALGVARARDAGRLLPVFTAGVCVGMLSLIRPLEGLVAALLLGVWSLGARGRRVRLAPSLALVAGSITTGALVLPYNRLLTGDATAFPIMAYINKYYVPGSNDLGFGANRGLGWTGLDPFPGHGAVDVVVNALLNSYQVNVELLGWPTGATVVLALLFVAGWRRLRRPDWWMVVAILSVVGIHSLYWFSGGPDFGARYWYLIIVPCAALVARAVLPGGAASTSRDAVSAGGREATPDASHAARLPAIALLLCVTSLTVYVPWRARKYEHYRGMRADVRELARTHGFADGLVLVRGRRHPDYASAAVYNPVDLSQRVPIYVWDASAELRERVLAAFPGRMLWVMDGPSLTGNGYRVVAGPLRADSLRASAILPSAGGDDHRVYDPVSPHAATPP